MEPEKQKFYLTNAIPYVNASPHIGFAMELVASDLLARFYRLAGFDVHFLAGTDENSLKNVLAAEKANLPTNEFVNEYARKFIDLGQALEISNDSFIRTTEKKHIQGAQKLWAACQPEDIYKKAYEGLYCVGCEQFYSAGELINGLCPEHGTKPELVKEENYFFKLSNYQKDLERLIESGELEILPAFRKKEIFNFIKSGLVDFSISRSRERARGWGVPVPGDDAQVMYVWFDALSCYITGLDYATNGELYRKYWPGNHMIGKGIIRFHAVYWPAMLLSAGLPLPKKIFVHGYLTVDGQKMGKSLGNSVDPVALIKKYGADPVRYFLLREIPFGQDGDFSVAKLEARYQGDLANGLGNLLSRVTNLVETDLDGVVPDTVPSPKDLDEVYDLVSELKFHEALEQIWKEIAWANKYIDETKLWDQAQKNPQLFSEVISNLVALLADIATKLSPFMPETAERIRIVLSAEKIKKSEPLFPRIST